jgi:hypothetical protein
MNEPAYNIGDKVKLANDDLIYTVLDVYKEGLIFKYKIISKNLKYRVVVKEIEITSTI